MPNPFDWDYLTTQPASGDVLDAFTIAFAVVFIAGFVASAYVYYRPWTRPFGAMFRRKVVIRTAGWAMWLFGIGLFFFLIRILQINPLSFGEPIWMWLSLLGVIVFAICIWTNWDRGRKSTAAVPERGRSTTPVTNAAKRPVRRDKAPR
jgi:magnesium-transporting ATPase (P-type)